MKYILLFLFSLPLLAANPAVIWGSGGTGKILPKNGLLFNPGLETLSGADVTLLKDHLNSTGTGFLLNSVAHGKLPLLGCPLAPVYFNGTLWVDAAANSNTTIATHVITKIVDADNLILSQAGRITCTGHGLTIGSYYYTGAAGGLSITEALDFSNPVVFVEDANTVHIVPYRAATNNATTATDISDLQANKLIGERLTVALVASTPLTISSPNISNIFSIQVYHNNEKIDLDIGRNANLNERILTSLSALTGVIVEITGKE